MDRAMLLATLVYDRALEELRVVQFENLQFASKLFQFSLPSKENPIRTAVWTILVQYYWNPCRTHSTKESQSRSRMRSYGNVVSVDRMIWFESIRFQRVWMESNDSREWFKRMIQETYWLPLNSSNCSSNRSSSETIRPPISIDCTIIVLSS